MPRRQPTLTCPFAASNNWGSALDSIATEQTSQAEEETSPVSDAEDQASRMQDDSAQDEKDLLSETPPSTNDIPEMLDETVEGRAISENDYPAGLEGSSMPQRPRCGCDYKHGRVSESDGIGIICIYPPPSRGGLPGDPYTGHYRVAILPNKFKTEEYIYKKDVFVCAVLITEPLTRQEPSDPEPPSDQEPPKKKNVRPKKKNVCPEKKSVPPKKKNVWRDSLETIAFDPVHEGECTNELSCTHGRMGI